MPLQGGHFLPAVARALRGRGANDLFPRAAHPECALAGLWLAAGGWNEAHEICQDIASPEGAYWHAIVHRQEPDPQNAKYWFGQVGRHPIFEELGRLAAAINRDNKLGLSGDWNPALFVDVCERAPGTANEDVAREVQQAEWNLLYAWCARSGLR